MRKIGDEVTYLVDGEEDNEEVGIIVGISTEASREYIITGKDGWVVSNWENEHEGYNIAEEHFGKECWYVSESDIKDIK